MKAHSAPNERNRRSDSDALFRILDESLERYWRKHPDYVAAVERLLACDTPDNRQEEARLYEEMVHELERQYPDRNFRRKF